MANPAKNAISAKILEMREAVARARAAAAEGAAPAAGRAGVGRFPVAPALTPEQASAVLRKVEQGTPLRDLSPQEKMALMQSPGDVPIEAPAGGAAAPDVTPLQNAGEAPVRRPFAQQGKELIGVDDRGVVGMRLRRMSKESDLFVYDDGTVVDVDGNVVGATAPGDLTDTSAAPAGNLEQSGIDLSTTGIKPNTARVTPVDSLASDLWQVNELEPLSMDTAKRLARRISQYAIVGDNGGVTYYPEFLEAIRYDRGGKERLEALAKMVGQPSLAPSPAAATPPPAPQAGRQFSTPAERAASQMDLQAAQQLVREGLPEGDWNALTERFNQFDAEQKARVMQGLSDGRSLQPADFGSRTADPKQPRPGHAERLAGKAAELKDREASGSLKTPGSDPTDRRGVQWGDQDMTAPQPLLASALETNPAEGWRGPVFTPNSIALLRRPVNPYHDALMQLDEAMRGGDAQAIAAARENVLTTPATPDEIEQANTTFMARKRAADALRAQIMAIDPTLQEAQSAARDTVARMPPSPTVLPQGARSADMVTNDLPVNEMPTQADAALAAERARQEQLMERASLDGAFTPEKREAMAVAAGLEDGRRPFFLRGADRENTPFEKRPRGRPDALGQGTRDGVTQAKELRAAREGAEADLTKAMYELRLAQIGRRSARATSTPDDIAAAQENVARLQDEVRSLYAAEDEFFKPRLVEVDARGVTTGRLARAADGTPLPVRQEYLDDPSTIPEGYALERGFSGMADSLLNKPSTQETYDGLGTAVAGFRPRQAGGLARSNPDLSPTERRIMGDELRDAVLGGEGNAQWMDEVYPDGRPDAEGVPDGQRGRRGRLGGSAQLSRKQAAVQEHFGAVNPFALRNTELKPLIPPGRDGAVLLAQDYLARNTDFKPGTPSYELALEEWAKIIEDMYVPRVSAEAVPNSIKNALPAGEEPADVASPGSVFRRPSRRSGVQPPAGESRPEGLDDPFDGDPNAKSVPPSKVGKGAPPMTREELDAKLAADDADGGAKLAASKTKLDDVAPAGPAAEDADSMGDTAPTPGALTDDEIKVAAQKEYDDAIRDGFSKKVAKERKQQYIKEAKAAQKGTIEVRNAAPAKTRVPTAAAPKTPRPLTQAELDDVAAEGRSIYSDAIAEGLDEDAARQRAEQWMEEERAVRSSQAAETSDADIEEAGPSVVGPPPAAQSAPAATPVAGAANAPAANAPAAPAAGAASPQPPNQWPPMGGKGGQQQQQNQWPNMQGGGKAAKKPKGKGAAATPAQPATPATPPPLPEPKSWIGRLLRYGAGGGLGIAGVTGALNYSDDLSQSDSLDLTDAVGGDPGGGQGLPPGYVPGPATVPSSATEARLQAIIDRLESSRRGGATSEPTYGTYQNINFWR